MWLFACSTPAGEIFASDLQKSEEVPREKSAPDGGDGGGDEVEAVDDGQLLAALALLHALRRKPVLDREEGACPRRRSSHQLGARS